MNEAFRHYKPIGIAKNAKQFLLAQAELEPGIIVADEEINFNEDFIAAIAAHRHWNREINK